MPVLHDAGEVGMSWSGTRDNRAIATRGVRRLNRLHVHRLLPVLPVFVRNQQRDRAAGRLAVANAAQRFRSIRFDGHAPSTSVAALTATQFRRDGVEID